MKTTTLQRVIAVLFLIVGLISFGNIYKRANKIADHKKRGIPFSGTVTLASSKTVQDGQSRYQTYRTIRTVLVATQLEGVLGTVDLKESDPIIAGLKPGDPVQMLYLPENLYIAKDRKFLDFIGDEDPVPASFTERRPFTEPIAFVGYGFLAAGVVLLFLRPRRRL